MLKKTLGLVIIAVMLLGVFGLTACNNDTLDAYKDAGKTAIQIHADSKGRTNYCDDNWTTICSLITAGKAAVDASENKPAVDIAVATAKAAINDVQREDANFEWTNSNAIYAFVKAGFESDILKDIEGSFEKLSFRKVYATEKNTNVWTPLALLFILEDGAEQQQELIGLLNQDTRINHASKSRDLPFETVDTRYIEREKDTIAVGETLTLEANGNIDYYVQPFDFKGFLVKPVLSKTYTVADFSQVNLKSVEARDNGWLYLELETEGYFNIVKAMDVFSRLSTIEKIEQDKSEIVFPVPPIWQISDTSTANYIDESDMYKHNLPLTIVGVKPGIVTISRDGVSCIITVA